MEQVVSDKEAQWLLELARGAVYQAITRKAPAEKKCVVFSPIFQETYGVFATIWLKGERKGCMGTPFPGCPLEEAVQRIAVQSAMCDERFRPLTLDELSDATFELSIMSPLTPIQPEAIEIGVHGLFLFHRSATSLLLPDVAVEFGWDLNTYLSMLCQKAGLPSEAWKEGELCSFELQSLRDRCD